MLDPDSNENKKWFKRVGQGRLPATWQGWLFLVLFAILAYYGVNFASTSTTVLGVLAGVLLPVVFFFGTMFVFRRHFFE